MTQGGNVELQGRIEDHGTFGVFADTDAPRVRTVPSHVTVPRTLPAPNVARLPKTSWRSVPLPESDAFSRMAVDASTSMPAHPLSVTVSTPPWEPHGSGSPG